MFQEFLRDTVPRVRIQLFAILILALALLMAQAAVATPTEVTFEDAGEIDRIDAVMPDAHMSGVFDDAGIQDAEVLFSTWIPFTSDRIDETSNTADTSLSAETKLAGVYFYRIEPSEAGNDALTRSLLTVDEQFVDIGQLRADVDKMIREQQPDEDKMAAIAAITSTKTAIDGGLAVI